MDAISESLRRRLSQLQPSCLDPLEQINELAQGVVDPQLLTLCIELITALHSNRAWKIPKDTSIRDRACLQLAEQFVLAVGSVSDNQIYILRHWFSADEIYQFVHMLYVLDMTLRLNRVTHSVLGPVNAI